jgi:phospholipase/carboxylesterase
MTAARGEARRRAAAEGRVLSRPVPIDGIGAIHPAVPADDRLSPGLHPLGLAPEPDPAGEPGRDGLLYVPSGYQVGRPTPVVVMFHGAGGTAHDGLWPLRELADEAGVLLFAPDSRRVTWDVILDRFGPDVAFVDRALRWLFERCVADPGRIAVGGFSDGASYALTLGLANGDLFTHVVAFSPGFIAPVTARGRPAIFIAHGTHDQVLPIDRCSRRIVPALQRADYDVRYREFDGPHTVPPEIAREGLDWFLPGA